MAMKNSPNTLFCGLSVLFVMLGMAGSTVSAQKPEVQRLFQSGSYEQAVDAARGGDQASTFLAAQSLLKLDRNDQAAAQLTQLKSSDQPAWRLIGESGEALMANDAGRAVQLARQAVEADGNNPFAQYQLGLAASKASDWGSVVAAFTKAILSSVRTATAGSPT